MSATTAPDALADGANSRWPMAARARALVNQRNFIILLLVLGVTPLLLPTVAPLIDLPNHMSRYAIGLEYRTSPYFKQWFDFRWVLVGNLGVDLLVTWLAPLFGVEGATKLVILTIPFLTIAGIGLIAREVHGRIPATAALAAVVTYNFAFNFGFVNYALSVGVALLLFGVWLWLGRLGKSTLRAWLFVPLGFVTWVCHACGWGILGVFIFTWEFASERMQGVDWMRSILRAVARCLPLTTPLLPMLFWSNALPHGSFAYFDFSPSRKIAILILALRNGIPLIDVGSMLILWGIGTVGIIRRDLEFDRRMTAVAAALLVTFLLMPVNLMGSGHADLRVGPYVVMLFLVALRPSSETRFTRALGVFSVLFFAVQMLYHAVVYERINRAQEHVLEAAEHIPVGARVFAFASVECSASMKGNRMDHVHRLAMVRRQAFTNGTWPYPASQTLLVHPDMVAGYGDESSQLYQPKDCREGHRHTIDGALASLPPGRFQYFWLLDVPPKEWPVRSNLSPIWHNDRTILYRIVPSA